jgi:hypothetical protein
VEFNNKIQPACLPLRNAAGYIHNIRTAVAVRWQRTQGRNAAEETFKMRNVLVPLNESANCDYDKIKTDSQICLGKYFKRVP